MLYRLLSRTDRENFEPSVVSLTDLGPVSEKIRALGVPMRALGMRRGIPDPSGIVRLSSWLRSNPPDVVQTWMYHENLIGGMAAKLAGGFPVVWGIHNSNLDPEHTKRTTIWTVRAGAWTSRWLPGRIVSCSEASRRIHEALGYAPEKVTVIPNGFDVTAFRPDPAARSSVRQEIGVGENTPLVGLMGRFHPQKDHRNFIRAAALLHDQLPDANFVLCGDGVTWKNPELAAWIGSAGIRRSCHLLGRRGDIPRLMAAMDVVSLSSAYGEAFPLTVGEAMACGVPCVVTDVGDSASIVGDTGRVVPTRDPRALAGGWRDLLGLNPEAKASLGVAARRRVEKNFNLPDIVSRYERLYEQIATRGDSSGRV